MMRLLNIFTALLALVLFLPEHAFADTRYVSASLANIREQPNANAKLLLKLPINQMLTFVDKQGEWCEVAYSSKSIKGFVQCQLLSNTPTTLAQIELDAANAVLANNRATLPIEGTDGNKLTINKYDEFEPINTLFKQLERHFYYSPSVNTYQLYQDLMRYTSNRFNEGENKPLPGEVERLIKAKAAQLEAMRAALNFNPAKNPYTPITKPITYTLTQLLKKRQGVTAIDKVQPSYFKNGAWSFGWEGGQFTDVKLDKKGNGFVYKVGFDAYDLNALGAVVEMAKHYQKPVQMTFRHPKKPGDLTQMNQSFDGTYEFGEVFAELPAYAITDKGLVKGLFKKASFAGDACWGDEGSTYAEFVFPKVLDGTVHGFFVASTAIDVNIAKVKVNKKTTHRLERLTHFIRAEVDLDNDGVKDLRTLNSNDLEVTMNLNPFLAQRFPIRKPSFLDVAGWYANDVYSLEANHDGQWQTLSIYNITTCT